MARTSDLQDFNTETIFGQEGPPMAVMLGLGDHLWKPHSVRSDRLWRTISGMAGQYTHMGRTCPNKKFLVRVEISLFSFRRYSFHSGAI